MSLRWTTWIGLAAALSIQNIFAFSVSGTITDSSGQPIEGIKVDIYDDDTLGNDFLATVYTNASGDYSASITGGYGVENPDIFLTVEWRWPILPSSDYGNSHVLLLKKMNDSGGGSFTTLQTFTAKSSAVIPDHDPATNINSQNLQMNQSLGVLDDVESLKDRINEALNYYRDNKGAVSWSWNEDVRLYILTNRGGSFVISGGSFAGESAPLLCMADVDVNGVASGGFQGYVSDIHHEMGHYVHYRINGGALPASVYSGSHNTETESDGPFALKEAWASYVGELTAQLHGHDDKYAAYRDDGSAPPPGWTRYSPRSLWRGDEASPTGLDTGTNLLESGEIVEGSLGGVWFGIHDDPLFSGFETNFKVMVDDKPDDITEFREGLINDVGSGTAAANRAYEIYAEHGIVYSRARFAMNPFSTPQTTTNGGAAVPADPGDGNSKVNKDEKYLKVIGAWYDKDRDPTTNPASEDRIYVDNTQPVVTFSVTP